MFFRMCSLFLILYCGVVYLIPIELGSDSMANIQLKRKRIIQYEDSDDDFPGDIPPSGFVQDKNVFTDHATLLPEEIEESHQRYREAAHVFADKKLQNKNAEGTLRIYEESRCNETRKPKWITELEDVVSDIEGLYLGPIVLLPSEIREYFTCVTSDGLQKTKTFYAALFFAVNGVPGKLALRFMIMRKNIKSEDMIIHFKDIYKKVMDEDRSLAMYYTYECRRASPVNCITRELVEGVYYPSGNINRSSNNKRYETRNEAAENRYF